MFRIPGSILCPIKAINRVLQMFKASQNGPLFAISNQHVFTYNMLQKKLKNCVTALGLKKHKDTSHSLRRGSVVWAEQSGVPHELIKVYGDWRSDAFCRYLQFPEKVRVAVSHKMVKNLQKYNLSDKFYYKPWRSGHVFYYGSFRPVVAEYTVFLLF